jgi:hypothetical protein
MPDDEKAAKPVEEILDAIPGAFERTQEGLADAARGEGTPLDALIDAAMSVSDERETDSS